MELRFSRPADEVTVREILRRRSVDTEVRWLCLQLLAEIWENRGLCERLRGTLVCGGPT